jgi:hypothetical protein
VPSAEGLTRVDELLRRVEERTRSLGPRPLADQQATDRLLEDVLEQGLVKPLDLHPACMAASEFDLEEDDLVREFEVRFRLTDAAPVPVMILDPLVVVDRLGREAALQFPDDLLLVRSSLRLRSSQPLRHRYVPRTLLEQPCQ